MDTTEQAVEAARPRDRVVRAATLNRPDDFADAVAALSGLTPLTDEMTGYAGRNDNWRVPTAEGRDLFVKRLRGEPDQVDARMSRLLAFQQWAAAQRIEELHTVHFHGADRDRALLVFDYLPDSRTAGELLAEEQFDTALAHRIGRILGSLHRPRPAEADDIQDASDGRAVGAFYALTPADYADCSGGEVEAWAMLQHDQVLIQALDRLRARSRQAPVTAAHCDIRLDQFLLSGGQVHVIDWEEFRYAEPAVDVGAFVGELLHHAAWKTFSELDVDGDLTPGAAHDAVVAAGADQLLKIRDHIARFWDGYRETADTDQDLPVRATGYAGWHFFDRLLATAVHGARLTAAQRGMAGIGRNALTNPEHFAATIGLDRG